MSKSSKNSFLMQGMILAAASIVCRVIGLLYRSPLFGIIGKEGMGYYSYQCSENLLWSISLCSCRWWYRVHDRIFWSTNLCRTSERCNTCPSGHFPNDLFLWDSWST